MHQQQQQQQMLGSSSGLFQQAIVSTNNGLPSYPGQYEATLQARGLPPSSPLYPTTYGQQYSATGGLSGQGLPVPNQFGQITATSISKGDTLNGAPSNIQTQPLAGSVSTRTRTSRFDRSSSRPWLFLINGGQETFHEEIQVREKLKRLHTLFVSNGIVEADCVVCASANGGIICEQEDTIVNATSVGAVINGRSGVSNQPFMLGPGLPQSSSNKRFKTINVVPTDSVIILFIGHQTFYGNASLGGGLFPSGFPNLGSLVFHNGNHQSRDDLSSFLNVQFGKCLFITQSSYSGGILQHVAKELYSKDREFLAISPGPDHPAAEGPILLDALIDYFTGAEWKEKNLGDLYLFIQERYHSRTPYQQVYEDEIALTEESYEQQRLETAGWATNNKFLMHQPSKIPAELWQVFRQVDGIKKTITNSNKGDIKAKLQDQFTSQMKIIQDSKFDLITMYKRKPNYKIHLYGSDILMEMKLADFLFIRDN